MAKSRLVIHPQAKHFYVWLESMHEGPLADATMSTYATDVARFLNWTARTPLRKIDSSHVANFISAKLTKAGRRRMLSALSEFWAYALRQRWVTTDIMRELKYRRSANASDAQLSIFELLKEQGVAERELKQLIWSDFVDPLVRRNKTKLRVGTQTIPITPYAWNRLNTEFRALAASHDLMAILKKRIA